MVIRENHIIPIIKPSEKVIRTLHYEYIDEIEGGLNTVIMIFSLCAY